MTAGGVAPVPDVRAKVTATPAIPNPLLVT